MFSAGSALIIPASNDAHAASKIVLATGERVTNLEVRLVPAIAYRVGGVLSNPDGKPAATTTVRLGEDAFLPGQSTDTRSDGSFLFPAVPGGEWLLSAEVESGGVKLRAAQWLDLTGRDVESLRLQLNRPFQLTGRITIDAPSETLAS